MAPNYGLVVLQTVAMSARPPLIPSLMAVRGVAVWVWLWLLLSALGVRGEGAQGAQSLECTTESRPKVTNSCSLGKIFFLYFGGQ